MSILWPVVERFVIEHIHSVEELEILLLLHARRNRSWTPEDIAHGLHLDPKATAETLADLQRRGFVVPGPILPSAVIYAPSLPDTEATFSALRQLYPRFRGTIIRLIESKPSAGNAKP